MLPGCRHFSENSNSSRLFDLLYPELHIFVATSLRRECNRVCKSVSGPIFGLCSEHSSVVFYTISDSTKRYYVDDSRG